MAYSLNPQAACKGVESFTRKLPPAGEYALETAQYMLNLCAGCPLLNTCHDTYHALSDYEIRWAGWTVLGGHLHPRYADLEPALHIPVELC